MTDSLPVSIAVATRTLIAGGYRITDVQRQPRHVEFTCERTDTFGSTIRYLFVLLDLPQPLEDGLLFARRRAEHEGLVIVLVAKEPGDGWLSWRQFLEALGGAVSVWRALVPDYGELVLTLGRNELPTGLEGEAWRLFEDAIADGLEFVLGHRVRRLGAHRRGEPVIDLVVRTPDDKIIVADGKASGKSFSVGAEELRPIKEYVQRQCIRQQGDLPVNGAVIVANSFQQGESRLIELSNDLLSEIGVPVAFLETESLIGMVRALEKQPHLRNKLRWSRILCRAGLVLFSSFEKELAASAEEYLGR